MSKTTQSTTRVLAMFGLFAMLAPLAVFAQSSQDFTIPFNFTVGSQTLNAGTYRVSEIAPYTLLIQGSAKHSTAIVATTPQIPETQSGLATMTFTRYGERYFLSRVAKPGRGWGLQTSRAEKELLAHSDSSRRVAVVASLRK